MKSLETSAHKQLFYTRGSYSIEKNKIDIATEIPQITLTNSGKDYRLELKQCYDISSESIPCFLAIYSHGHPTDRKKLAFENLDWNRDTLELDSIFKVASFTNEKILVITLHDEDFEDSNIEIYRFFVKHHVTFNSNSKEYECDMELLQKFVAGIPANIIEEEPRTVGGGVLHPA
ncbi:hypothetical protein [uncultured Lacinutrix sp.]|uniref:hypothetical protein n=1 Tax=uncultured Lacinutrix sp. TaxID=574032 RepID=UPI002625FA8A|nr:hypothetical protein [uncultured Lacinutrix sp.]